MTKRFVYIFSRDGQELSLGYCSDIRKTIANYKALPSMHYPPKPHQLVYLEQCKDTDEAQNRLDILLAMTKTAKIALIEANQQQSQELINSL